MIQTKKITFEHREFTGSKSYDSSTFWESSSYSIITNSVKDTILEIEPPNVEYSQDKCYWEKVRCSRCGMDLDLGIEYDVMVNVPSEIFSTFSKDKEGKSIIKSLMYDETNWSGEYSQSGCAGIILLLFGIFFLFDQKSINMYLPHIFIASSVCIILYSRLKKWSLIRKFQKSIIGKNVLINIKSKWIYEYLKPYNLVKFYGIHSIKFTQDDVHKIVDGPGEINFSKQRIL